MTRFLALLAFLAGPHNASAAQVLDSLVAVPADRVNVESTFWAPRIASHRDVTLPAVCARLEEEGYLANFDKAAGGETSGHVGGPDADAAVYKTIRAVALMPESPLRATAEAWIPRIAAAQEDDGYLHTYVAIERPGARYREMARNAETYCLAALIDAGLAWERATGDAALLDVAVRAADRLDRAVRVDELLDPPGRPAVERALVELFRRTQREDWLWLADDLLLQRGSAEGRSVYGPELQDMIPVRSMMGATGDALGLLGLQRGMLEVYAATGDRKLLSATLNVWKDVSQTRSFVTGGVGVEPRGLFAEPHVLPAKLARAEATTTVELIRQSRRFLELTRQAAFADAEEHILYNAFAAAMSPDGRGLLDACPLAAPGGLERRAWFEDPRAVIAVAEFMPELTRGAVLHDEDEVYVAHYLAGTTEMILPNRTVKLVQETNYPWDGSVRLRVVPDKPTKLMIHARVPIWAGDTLRAGVDDSVSEITIDRGDEPGMWLSWERVWTGKEVITLEFPMAPRRIEADPRVDAQRGRVAIARGPLVYALEGVDNEGNARARALPPEARLTQVWEDGLAGGGMIVRTDGVAKVDEEGDGSVLAAVGARITAIPYALIANRGLTDLVVWIPTDEANTSRDGRVREQVGALRVSASHCYRLDSLSTLFDGAFPERSRNQEFARMTFRPRTGGREWIEIEFPEPRTVSGVRVFWVDDAVDAEGRCDTPRSWRMARRTPEGWAPLDPAEGEHYWTSTDQLREVPFDGAYVTDAVRVDLTLRAGRSAGLFELEILSP